METFGKKSVILPQDFVQFIRRNYERIEEIEKKVEQFRNDPWNRNALQYRSFKNFQLYKLFDSVDSCFSEEDVKKVIHASIKPKLERLNDAEDRIQVGTEYLDNLKQQGSLDASSEDYETIVKNFPLVSISKNNGQKTVARGYGNHVPHIKCLLVQGIHLTFSERQRQNGHLIKRDGNITTNRDLLKHAREQKVTNRRTRLRRQECSSTSFKKSLKIKVPLGDRDEEGSFSSCENCRDNEIERARDAKLYSIVPPNFQLTLPPLHSSVLTLLGQRSAPKPSPRNLLTHAQEPSISSGVTRHKKLRRHGRNRNKNQNKGKPDELQQGERAGSEEIKKPPTDEPNETQVSTYPDNDDQGTIDGRLERGAEFQDSSERLQKISESRKALFNVLDDHLEGNPWNPKDMANLDEEIRMLTEDFNKYETKFKTNLIKMKEDYWLSFPRTWSRSSATFGVPYETRSLKELTSLDYLERFVTISDPRKHLYSLIFHRHRMISNPTGKHITLKTCKQALTEVLGRPFLEVEMKQLCDEYLGCIDTDLQIFERPFHGIGAFCERIYACYSLEEHHECHICYDNPSKDKRRCHKDQKSHLEKADLAYLSLKVRQGEVQPNLSNLLRALCDRD